MRTLFLCPRPLWPLDTGAKQRDFHLASALAAAGETTLLAFGDTPDAVLPPSHRPSFAEVIAIPRPPAYAASKLARGFIGSQAIGVLNFTSAAMDEALHSVLARRRFDTVHISCVQMAAYLPTVRRHGQGAKVLCDWHNIESELMRRYAARSDGVARKLYALRTARNLERAERRMLANVDGVLVTSERERIALGAAGSPCPVHVVENGVDMGRFGDVPGRLDASQPKTTLLFVGSMDYHANIDAVVSFAAAAWPALKRAVPGLTFRIVGRNPTPAVLELAKLDGVVVTGSVDDVGPHYADAVAAVVPLRVGGGTRLKILEAMGYAAPVVSTTLGIEGLVAQPDRHYLRADTPEAMVSAVVRLVNEPDLAARLASAALELVGDRYDWAQIGAGLVRLHRGYAGLNEAGVRMRTPGRDRDALEVRPQN